MFKYFREIKNRVFLIFMFLFYNINVLYYYKEILLFLFIKQLFFYKSTNYYLIYTNITEVFFVYIKLINFLSLQLAFIILIFHTLHFLCYGLYKQEFIFLKNTLYFYMFLYIFILYLINQILFPMFFEFFKQFDFLFILNSMYFEIKIKEYLSFFQNTFKLIQLYCCFIFILILTLFKQITKDKIKKFRKLIYFIFYLVICFFYFNLFFDIFLQLLILHVIIILYEFILILFIFQNKIISNWN